MKDTRSETRLQQDLFVAHWMQYPEERRRLFTVNNNSHNRVKGAKMKALGVVKGVSDMIYLNPRLKIPQYIELKKPDGSGVQSKEQKEFEAIVRADGYEYHLVKNEEEFNEVTGLSLGEPYRTCPNCGNNNTRKESLNKYTCKYCEGEPDTEC